MRPAENATLLRGHGAEAFGGDRLESVPQRGHALLAEAFGPVALEVVDQAAADGVGLAAPGGQADDLRAPVVRVRDSFDVAAPLQVGGRLAHRLLGHAGALGEVGESRAVRVDGAEHAPVARAEVGIAGRLDASCELLGELVEGVIQQADERRPLRVTRITLHFVRTTDKVAEQYGHLTSFPDEFSYPSGGM